MATLAERILFDEERPLRRMDIFLTKDRRSWLQGVISRSTQCFWAHPAVTFLIPSPADGFRHAFVMESAGEGVDVHNALKYFEKADRYDFAIVRPKAEWFSGATPEHESVRRLARGRMLEYVDAEYDKATVLKLFFDLLFRPPYMRSRSQAKKPRKPRQPPTEKQLRRTPQEFMCSAFASYSLYKIALELDAKDNGSRVDDVLFNPLFDEIDWDSMSYEQRDRLVLSTTPADMALSPLLDWKWVVVKGEAHKVDTRLEADEHLRRAYGKLPSGHDLAPPAGEPKTLQKA